MQEKSVVTNSRWYPSYHIAAPSGWVNDPNGFCFFNGQYHFFYQHYPYAPQWGPMHWGHVVGKDLVHWKHLPIALAPDKPYDKDGCFSGCGLEKDGKLYLVYTGHCQLPEGNELGLPHTQTQCIAFSEDGINFTKLEENPVIAVPENEEIHKGDFRDPKVWSHDGKYYMVVGSRTPDETTGQLLLFESEDLMDWKFKNISARAEGNQGNMWECPNFAEIDGQDVLIMSPQGIEREENKFVNVYQSGYMVGKMNYDTGIFTHGDFDLLDYGFDFYAPQIIQTPDGRTVLIGWLDMWFSPMPENQDGWSCMMTVPRELHVRNGKIFSTPIRELESLRTSKKIYRYVKIDKPKKFKDVRGEIGELVAKIDASGAKKFYIEFRSSEEQKTVLSFDTESGLVQLNRDRSGEGVEGTREVTIKPTKIFNLRVYLDRSSLEIFINDGEAVLSSRIYSNKFSRDIVFAPEDGTLNLKRVIFYTLEESFPQPEVK